jgi:putative ABC transport system permease protein
MFKAVRQDILFGLRMLAKTPGFTFVAVLTLAVGIGANTTVFTIVNAMLFKGLPYPNSDRIVSITSNNLAKNRPQIGVAYPDFLDWRLHSKAFKGLAIAQMSLTNISDPDLPAQQYYNARISANTFSLLGQRPFLGRDFLPEESEGKGADVVILGYSLWQTRYGGNPNILGKVLRLNEQDFTVVGVMPEGVKFPYNQELWIPIYVTGPASNLNRRDVTNNIVFGRLADGESIASAQAEMNVIATRLQKDYPDTNTDRGITVMPYTSFFGGPTLRNLFLAMLGAVGFVLLIACANVANLLLARSVTRAREVSIRAALGASRARVVGQLLVESVLLSVMGGTAGFFLSIFGIRAFQASLPPWVPYWLDFSVDYAVFAYLACICVATTLLFGLAPALHATKVDLSETLKEGTRGSGGTHTRLLSRGLVVAEVALALVLLVAAGLMIRSFLNVQEMSASFQNEKTLTGWIFMGGTTYITFPRRVQFLERLESELRNIPAAKVAMGSSLPLGGGMNSQFEVDGIPVPDPKDRPSAVVIEITPEYFEVLGLPILRGRTFEQGEGSGNRSAVIVNQHFATKYWSGEDPIGKRVRMIRPPDNQQTAPLTQPVMTVVGVAPDVRQNWDPNAPLDPVMYVPYHQGQSARAMAIIARGQAGDGHSLTPVLRSAIQRANNAIPLIQPMTLPEYFAQNRWFQRVFSILFAVFGLIGLLLAVVGIYAVIAYSVSQRTREIGIRMALGGEPVGILRLVVAYALRLAVLGVAIGLGTSYAVTRVMKTVLVGVGATDTLTFAAVALTLTAVAALAGYVPARRASRVDPVLALRTE